MDGFELLREISRRLLALAGGRHRGNGSRARAWPYRGAGQGHRRATRLRPNDRACSHRIGIFIYLDPKHTKLKFA
jgi:hypothetical protein